MSNRVFNQFDADVIRRVRLGIKHKDIPAKRVKPKRMLASYRAARRNATSMWRGVKPDHVSHRVSSYRLDDLGRRVPCKTYQPNGEREVARRQRQRLQREGSRS